MAVDEIVLGGVRIPPAPENGAPFWFQSLTGWRDLSDDKTDVVERAQAHGASVPRRLYRASLPISITVCASAPGDVRAVLGVMETLRAEGADRPLTMRVKDNAGVFERQVTVRHIAVDDHNGQDWDKATIDVLAYDSAMYQPDDALQWVTVSPASPQGGLKWPVVWPAVWSSEGSDGILRLTNPGSRPSAPLVRVYGGFTAVSLKNTDTGAEVALRWPVGAGTYVEFDFARRRVWLNGQSDVSRYLYSRQWWDVAGLGSTSLFFSVEGATGAPYAAGAVRGAF